MLFRLADERLAWISEHALSKGFDWSWAAANHSS